MQTIINIITEAATTNNIRTEVATTAHGQAITIYARGIKFEFHFESNNATILRFDGLQSGGYAARPMDAGRTVAHDEAERIALGLVTPRPARTNARRAAWNR